MDGNGHDANAMAEARARARAAGLGADDLDWFERLGWRDAAAPEIQSEGQFADYRRREAGLNRAVEHLTFAERAQSPEGRLAAALGARIADWKDAGEED